MIIQPKTAGVSILADEDWLGNEFAVTETGVLQSLDLYCQANAAAGSDQWYR